MSSAIKDHGWEAQPRSLEKLLASRIAPKKAEPIKANDIKVPNTKLAKDVTEYTRREYEEKTFNHCMRVFCYGNALSNPMRDPHDF